MLPTCATRATRRVFKPIGGILLIDDAYNASPESVRCALRFLSAQAIGRRVLLLGDMLELGKDSAFLHTEIGKEAAACADIVFFYGAYRDAYVQGAHKIKGGARIHPLHSQSEEDAAREMLPYLKAGDTVLFKSSNKGGAKKIFEHLRSLLS